MLHAASEQNPYKFRHVYSVLREGMRAKIVKGPLRGFGGVIELQLSESRVRLRINSAVVMRVEIAKSHLRQTGDA